jgi:hypothetical protein
MYVCRWLAEQLGEDGVLPTVTTDVAGVEEPPAACFDQ